jgi:predicted lipid-binding transport protein (Tim44 family)
MSQAKPSWRILLAFFCGACLALMPPLADARAGSSYGGRPSSFGSRGVRSWDHNGAQPLERSLAPQTPSQPGPAAGFPASPYGGGAFQRHPFLTGLAGGLFGSWLFGHAARADGGAGSGSFLGSLVWLAIIGGLVWLAVRRFRSGAFSRRAPAEAPGFMTRSAGAAAAPVGRLRGRDVNLADADLQAFQRLHVAIQEAWSGGDLARMGRLMTPEMLSYFSDELTRNTSRGLRNLVSNVQLVNGELTEAWEQGDLQYATALLRWRAIDYTLRLAAPPGDRNSVVGGDPRVPAEVEELWTFVRQRGGEWLLSAIQQV